ncbi:hypothetical protein QYM36_017678 [Artemia franciscana]|uniref:Uncharacterized protein n=1 Tax=Artemia franciscana TaxID=6661 RepID=A0AA88HEC5_ARTSF|nr:hypothetical protein QYM36_017678 [Artemia franciscana]
MEKKTCVVLHIQENFQKYLNILTKFVDYLIIEDESVSRSDFVDNSEIFEASSFISKYSCEISVAKFITLWIPKASNVKNVLIDNRLCLIEGSLDSFIEIQQNHQLANILDERKCHPTPLHSLFPSDERLKPVVDSVRKIYLQVSEMDALEEYWSNSLLLQKSFINEGKLQEELNESKYANECSEINQNIFEEREFRMKHGFETDPLIMYFLESFQKNDIDETLLHH